MDWVLGDLYFGADTDGPEVPEADDEVQEKLKQAGWELGPGLTE